jgi:hypothetical protein
MHSLLQSEDAGFSTGRSRLSQNSKWKGIYQNNFYETSKIATMKGGDLPLHIENPVFHPVLKAKGANLLSPRNNQSKVLPVPSRATRNTTDRPLTLFGGTKFHSSYSNWNINDALRGDSPRKNQLALL